MISGSSLIPRSRTDWLPIGIPASARRPQASWACGVSSAGWLKCVLTYSGWYLRSIATNSSVTRMGSTTGTRVPIRTMSTDGTDRRAERTCSRCFVLMVNGSPPETITSRTSGWLVRYETT